MKKKTEVKNFDKKELIMYGSIVLNIVLLVFILSFWLFIKNAGTSSYNQATLNRILSYTNEQFCNGDGYEKIISEIKAGTDPEEFDKSKSIFDKQICGIE